LEDNNILFLGAGASVPYRKPTTKQFKHILMNKYKYEKHTDTSKEQYYLDSILNFPDFHDIEDVLQCVKEIEDFFSNSKFGGRFLESKHEIKSTQPPRPWELKYMIDNIKKIRRIIEDDVFSNYAWDHSDDPILDTVIPTIFKIAQTGSNKIHIFTTNYDRSIEEYCSDSNRKLRCIDGFRRDEFNNRRIWDGNFEYPVDENSVNVYLYKLHGSLNWKRHRKYGIEATSEETRSPDPNYIENLLVYPTISPKDGEEKEPYKTIRERFEKYMNTANVCIVIGFSFRDEHINKIFSSFIHSNRKLIVISNSAFHNLYTNLLKKDISDFDGKEEEIKGVKVYSEKNNFIAINSNIDTNNIQSICKIINTIINR
jgi:hypothetical protein